MIQYQDLTLDDVSYYWSGSVLLFEREGVKIPCQIADISSESRYPITLVDKRDGSKLISLKLSSFISRVLIHHPALGYGDYKGLPVYVSTVAGRGLHKGMDTRNIVTTSPVDWKSLIKSRMKALTVKANKYIESGKSVPTTLAREYDNLRNYTNHMPSTIRRRRVEVPTSVGVVRIRDTKVLSNILYQCVNDIYPPLTEALRVLSGPNPPLGQSVSKDFALIRTSNSVIVLYHRRAKVGTISPKTLAITFNNKLSKTAATAVGIAFDHLRSK